MEGEYDEEDGEDEEDEDEEGDEQEDFEGLEAIRGQLDPDDVVFVSTHCASSLPALFPCSLLCALHAEAGVTPVHAGSHSCSALLMTCQSS